MSYFLTKLRTDNTKDDKTGSASGTPLLQDTDSSWGLRLCFDMFRNRLTTWLTVSSEQPWSSWESSFASRQKIRFQTVVHKFMEDSKWLMTNHKWMLALMHSQQSRMENVPRSRYLFVLFGKIKWIILSASQFSLLDDVTQQDCTVQQLIFAENISTRENSNGE